MYKKPTPLRGAGLTLLGALLLWRLFPAHPYWRLVLWIYLGVVLHIGMDVLTPYGTQSLLAPDDQVVYGQCSLHP